MLTRHRVSRIFWNKHFFDYPISLSASTLKAMGPRITVEAGFSYLKSVFHKLPEDNFENFYINRFGRKLYSMFFEGYTEKLWGRHPSEISADWGSQRVKGLIIMGVLKNAVQKLLPKKRSNAEVETSEFGGIARTVRHNGNRMDIGGHRFFSKDDRIMQWWAQTLPLQGAPSYDVQKLLPKKRSNAEVETSLIEEFWYPKLGPGQLWETVEQNCVDAGVDAESEIG